MPNLKKRSSVNGIWFSLLLFVLIFVSSCSPKSIEFIGISELETEKMTLSETELSFKLVINNPNHFGLRLDDNQYKINLKGLSADLISAENWKIKHGKNYLTCKVKYNTLGNLKAAKELILNGFDYKELTLHIKGESTARKFVFKKIYKYESDLKIFSE